MPIQSINISIVLNLPYNNCLPSRKRKDKKEWHSIVLHYIYRSRQDEVLFCQWCWRDNRQFPWNFENCNAVNPNFFYLLSPPAVWMGNQAVFYTHPLHQSLICNSCLLQVIRRRLYLVYYSLHNNCMSIKGEKHEEKHVICENNPRLACIFNHSLTNFISNISFFLLGITNYFYTLLG